MTPEQEKECREAFEKEWGVYDWGCIDVAYGLYQAAYQHQQTKLTKQQALLERMAEGLIHPNLSLACKELPSQ